MGGKTPLLFMAVTLLISIPNCSAKRTRYYNINQNSAQLNQIFKQYETDISQLSKQIDRLKEGMASSKANTSVVISKLSEGMANQRDIIYRITESLTLPFNVSLCDCYLWTQKQKADLRNELNGVDQSMKKLQADIDAHKTDPPCQKITYLEGELAKMNQYARDIRTALQSDCCKQRATKADIDLNPTGLVNLIGTSRQTNLKADNWCYGSLTPDALRLWYFSRSALKNVTNCPISTPFWDGKKCIRCSDGTVFDLSKDKCLKPIRFNPQTKECSSSDSSASRQEKDLLREIKSSIGGEFGKQRTRAADETFTPVQEKFAALAGENRNPVLSRGESLENGNDASTEIISRTIARQKDAVYDPIQSQPSRYLSKRTKKSSYKETVMQPFVAEPRETAK